MTPTSPNRFKLDFIEWIKLLSLAVSFLAGAYGMHFHAIYRLGIAETKIESLHSEIGRLYRTVDRLADRIEGKPGAEHRIR